MTNMADPRKTDPDVPPSHQEILYGEQTRLAIANLGILAQTGVFMH
jgi:hypothetical protein